MLDLALEESQVLDKYNYVLQKFNLSDFQLFFELCRDLLVLMATVDSLAFSKEKPGHSRLLSNLMVRYVA